MTVRVACCAGDKYSVLLVEDPDAEEEDARGGPRIAFQIMPRAAVEPAPAPGWQSAAAAVLFLFTIGSSLQLGLAANVSLLPKVGGHSASFRRCHWRRHVESHLFVLLLQFLILSWNFYCASLRF